VVPSWCISSQQADEPTWKFQKWDPTKEAIFPNSNVMMPPEFAILVTNLRYVLFKKLGLPR
jgi:hypothetical protein